MHSNFARSSRPTFSGLSSTISMFRRGTYAPAGAGARGCRRQLRIVERSLRSGEAADNLGTGPDTDVYFADPSQRGLIDQQCPAPAFESNWEFVGLPRAELRDGGKETRFAVCVNALKRCKSGCSLWASVPKFSGFAAPIWPARLLGHRYRQSAEPCAHLIFDLTGDFHGPIHQHDAEPRTG